MDFRLNNVGAVSGAMLILVPFVISVVLGAVFIPIETSSEYRYLDAGAKEDLYDCGIYEDDYDWNGYNYTNMTPLVRRNFLDYLFGGDAQNCVERVFNSYLTFFGLLELPPLHLLDAVTGYYTWEFPDGTIMSDEEYKTFVSGDWDCTSPQEDRESGLINTIFGMLTLNPPALQMIEPYGGIIQIILITSVIIGIVDITLV